MKSLATSLLATSLLLTTIGSAMASPAAPAPGRPRPVAPAPLERTIVPVWEAAPRPDGSAGYRSPGTALALSLVPAAAGGLLVAIGSQSTDHDGAYQFGIAALIVGPSVGQFYADAPGSALVGVGLRSAGAFLASIGRHERLVGSCWNGPSSCQKSDGTGLETLGYITIAMSAAYSSFVASAQADAFNHRFEVAPAVMPTAHGSAPGLLVSGSF